MMGSLCRSFFLKQFRNFTVSELSSLNTSKSLSTRPVLCRQLYLSASSSSSLLHRNLFFESKPVHQTVSLFSTSSFNYATKNDTPLDDTAEKKVVESVKPSIFQRFKQMYKEYWYVLIPVHLVTSAAWFGGFYYAAKSGVDVVALLESLGVSEKLINPLRNSSAGYVALAYAMYKVATPARYAVTLGGTTVSIKYLTQWGYIKPVPTKAELKSMYHERKETFNRQREKIRQKIRHHRTKWRKKQEEITFRKKPRP